MAIISMREVDNTEDSLHGADVVIRIPCMSVDDAKHILEKIQEKSS